MGRIAPKLQIFRLLALLSASRYAFGMDVGTGEETRHGISATENARRPAGEGELRRYKNRPAAESGTILQEQLGLMPTDAAEARNSSPPIWTQTRDLRLVTLNV